MNKQAILKQRRESRMALKRAKNLIFNDLENKVFIFYETTKNKIVI